MFGAGDIAPFASLQWKRKPGVDDKVWLLVVRQFCFDEYLM